jgi:hypothetical protein
MEEQLTALLASEEEILAGLHGGIDRSGDRHLFFPALQTWSSSVPEAQNPMGERPANEASPLLGRLVRACEERYLFARGEGCFLCGRQQNSSANSLECEQCGTPMNGSVLKENIQFHLQERRWKYIRIFDLLRGLGEQGFVHDEWSTGIVVRNGKTEYRLEWADVWYLLRKDGTKMLETRTNHQLMRGLWKLWKKGGAYDPYS